MDPIFHYSMPNYVVNAAIQLGAFWIVVRAPRKPAYLIYFALYVLFFAVNSLAWVGFSGFVDPVSRWFYFMSFAVSFVGYFFTCFLYEFMPIEEHDREARVFKVIGLIPGCLAYASFFWETAGATAVFLPVREMFGYRLGLSTYMLALSVVLTYAFALVLLVRKYFHFRDSRPTEARVTLQFMVVTLIAQCDWFTFVAVILGFVDYSVFQIVHSTATNLVILGDTLIFLNAASHHTSLLTKIVGVSFAVTLTIIGLLSRVTFGNHEALMAREMRSAVLNVVHADARSRTAREARPGTPASGETTLFARFDYVVRYPADDPRMREPVFVRSSSTEIPAHRSVPTGRLFETVAGEGTQKDKCYKAIRIEEDGIVYEAGETIAVYLKREVHPVVLQFVLGVMLSGLLILVAFPMFFRGNLIRPLSGLLSGVRRVEKGDYSRTVTVHHADEIGSLTESFNEMTRAILTYQDRLVQSSVAREAAQAEALKSREMALESLSEKRRLELALLKRSIQPHFLMNSLNTTLGLIRENPTAAQSLILALADEIRKILDLSDRPMVPMDEEVSLCRAHLEVMSLRLERTFCLETRGLSGREGIPPLVVLTLVENGLSHQKQQLRNAAFLLEKTVIDGADVYTFRSPAAGLAEGTTESSDRQGTGTKYIKSRLENAFPGRWTFSTSRHPGEFVTTISIQTGERIPSGPA